MAKARKWTVIQIVVRPTAAQRRDARFLCTRKKSVGYKCLESAKKEEAIASCGRALPTNLSALVLLRNYGALTRK
jgi:hypothetical protein